MTRVALVGLGPIGIEVGRALLARGVEIPAAADPAPGIVGADLGTLLGGAASGVTVMPAAGEAFARGGLTAAVLCTGSRVPQVAGQIEEAVAAGLHVVSTCEELAYPWLRHPELADRLDAAARARGVAVVGTGVNPGLVMDRLPLLLAQGCARVDAVRVERVVDAARRRGPLRAKVGAGLTVAEFAAGVAAGRLGHVGLAESAALVALGLGFPFAGVEETIEPVLDPEGAVLGLRQTARAGARVVLDLAMYVGAPDGDHVVIEGDPPVDARVVGGFHGDRATVGAVVNAVALAYRLGPGIWTATSYR